MKLNAAYTPNHVARHHQASTADYRISQNFPHSRIHKMPLYGMSDPPLASASGTPLPSCPPSSDTPSDAPRSYRDEADRRMQTGLVAVEWKVAIF